MAVFAGKVRVEPPQHSTAECLPAIDGIGRLAVSHRTCFPRISLARSDTKEELERLPDTAQNCVATTIAYCTGRA